MSTVLNRIQWFTNTFVFCDSCSISVLNTYNRNMSVATENRKHVQYLTCTCTFVFSTFTC